MLPGNENKSEPVYTNADYIYHFNPDAKIIVPLRNPINRYMQHDLCYLNTA